MSNSFPAVAADPQKRLRFARECVGIIADYGFDGIVSVFLLLKRIMCERDVAYLTLSSVLKKDIDWEYPGYEPHG